VATLGGRLFQTGSVLFVLVCILFNFQHVLDFSFAKQSHIFFLRRSIKEAKNSGKEEERKVTCSLTGSFTKQKAESRKEARREVI
jgi:hypothetical protein